MAVDIYINKEIENQIDLIFCHQKFVFVSAEVVELFPQPLTLPKQTNIGFLGIFETTLRVDIVVLDSFN